MRGRYEKREDQEKNIQRKTRKDERGTKLNGMKHRERETESRNERKNWDPNNSATFEEGENHQNIARGRQIAK